LSAVLAAGRKIGGVIVRSRRFRILAAAAVVGLLVVAAASAKTIRGTGGADTLRGTAAADVIYGLAGNDRISGRGGNDRLIGGAGVDRISCGPGRDRVVADALDRVAGDCEVVSRPAPPTPPTPEPPPQPAPPPAGPLVTPGHYVSSTPQGRYVHFDVNADGRSLTNLRVEANSFCNPPADLRGVITLTGSIPISADKTFAVDTANSDRSIVLTLRGQFDALENVTGSFQLQWSVDEAGTRYQCSSGTVTFSGRRQG
jgi:RTX calcium-binding nonapeptide repeat (4 copies)